jgi:hypothetical protein
MPQLQHHIASSSSSNQSMQASDCTDASRSTVHQHVLCRSGSVCLDVINQTWSPMFGEPEAATVATAELESVLLSTDRCSGQQAQQSLYLAMPFL